MRDKNQQFIFNDAELQLIRVTFADNEALLYSIRKVLLQFPLTSAESALVKQAMTPEVLAVVKKRIYPDLDHDAPLTQIADYRASLTNDLRSKPFEDVEKQIESTMIVMEYLEQQMEALRDIDSKTVRDGSITLADLREMKGKDAEKRYIELRAYLDILGYVDPQLNHLKIIAGYKEESTEHQKDRLTRNSSK